MFFHTVIHVDGVGIDGNVITITISRCSSSIVCRLCVCFKTMQYNQVSVNVYCESVPKINCNMYCTELIADIALCGGFIVSKVLAKGVLNHLPV